MCEIKNVLKLNVKSKKKNKKILRTSEAENRCIFKNAQPGFEKSGSRPGQIGGLSITTRTIVEYSFENFWRHARNCGVGVANNGTKFPKITHGRLKD